MSRGQHIDLFAGVSMTSIPLAALGFETIAWAENDKFCQRVLRARHPSAVGFSDVRDVMTQDAVADRDVPLLISGGFPCPTISDAGYKAGIAASLWPEFARIIEDYYPEYVVAENVAALRRRGLDMVLSDLARLGYNARWDCIPAGAVGAPHLRDRMFIVACPNYAGQPSWWDEALAYRDTAAHWNLRVDQGASGALRTLPRAGELRGRFLRAATPAAPVKAVNAHVRARLVGNATLLPSTASGTCRTKLLPTVTKQEGVGGPGTSPRREGGKNLRTVVAEQYGNARIAPTFAEWMMGVPYGWTDPLVSNAGLKSFGGWNREPVNVVAPAREPDRRERIRACGNGLVPQALAYALRMLTELSR